MGYSNAKKHLIISIIKSIMRIIGFGILPFSILVGAIILAMAEVVGIWEELV